MESTFPERCPICGGGTYTTKSGYIIHLKVQHKTRPNNTFKKGLETKTQQVVKTHERRNKAIA